MIGILAASSGSDKWSCSNFSPVCDQHGLLVRSDAALDSAGLEIRACVRLRSKQTDARTDRNIKFVTAD